MHRDSSIRLRLISNTLTDWRRLDRKRQGQNSSPSSRRKRTSGPRETLDSSDQRILSIGTEIQPDPTGIIKSERTE